MRFIIDKNKDVKTPCHSSRAFCPFGSAANFLDLGSLSLKVTKIIELRTANLTAADDLHVINTGAVHGEGAFHTDAVGNTANSEGFTAGTIALGNDDAFESLKTLAVSFNDLDEHTQGVANIEGGQGISTQLGLLDGTDDFAHGVTSS